MNLIFSDFDGTLTDETDLGPIFFDILNLIQKNNAKLIVVSGRSLSWGHFYLTHFPIDTAIMEGGGVLTSMGEKGVISNELYVESSEVERLENVVIKMRKEFPHLSLSADSFGRKTDRAIELCDLKKNKQEVEAFLTENNVNHSCSSVHLNFWCGEISKANAVKSYLEENHPGINQKDCLYFGDALNDQSMFKEFPRSVGVSNIKSYLDKMQHKPNVILEGHENRGPYGVYNYLSEFWK